MKFENWKKPALSAVAFFGTLGTLYGVQAAFTSFVSSDYAAPRAGGSANLTSALWNKVIDNVVDQENRISGAVLWKEFTTPLTKEIGFTGAVLTSGITVSGVPATARYLLADVFVTVASSDHQNVVIGRGLASSQKNWVGTRGSQPSAEFGNMARKAVTLTYYGEVDGFTSNYGIWYSSQSIPLNNGGTFDLTNYGNNGTAGWVYMVIRGYSE